MPLAAPTPPDEERRLARLHALSVLDTDAEPIFDALTRAAALVAGAPIALVSLIDSDRQWFKSNLGLPGTAQTPRDAAFCAHTILDDGVLEVSDARADARFADNPLVVGQPGIRFYAGAPIIMSDGLRVGSLCVIDREPRTLDLIQRDVLRALANAAAEALEQRVLAQERTTLLQREAETGAKLAHVLEAAGVGTCEWNVRTGNVRFNDYWAHITGHSANGLDASSSEPWLDDVQPEDLERLRALLDQHLSGKSPVYDVETRVHHQDGHWLWVHDRGRVAISDDDGRPQVMYGTRIDIDASKRIELALAHSEARVRTLYRTTPAIMHSIDAEGRLSEVSDLWLCRLGYERGEVISRPLVDFLTDSSRRLSETLLIDLFRHGHCESSTFQMRHKCGGIVEMELAATLERDESGRPLRGMCVMQDLGMRRDAERRLAASEAFLDRTGKLAGVGGWEVDLGNGEIVWSDETCRLHELPPGHRPTLDEAIGYYAPEAREAIQNAVRKAIDQGVPWDLELPMITAKGRHFWGRAVGSVEFESGRAVRLAGAFQDITFRRRAVESLEASDRRFRKFFQYSLGLICTHDLDGVILSVNPAATSSLGHSVADMTGRNLEEFIAEEFHPVFRAYLARIGTTGSDSGLLQLIARDGSARMWQYNNVLDDEGDEPYVLGHAQDITERQQHVQQLRDWSIRDALTGCYNRRFLNEMQEAMAPGDVWGCIAVDLDKFKQVNDRHGHQRGDEVLAAIADFLHAHQSSGDIVVRAGGDEFFMLLKDADEARTSAVAAQLVADRHAAPIAFTLGLAVRRGDASLQETLVSADQQLYAARATRRVR